jgi:SAM-dependent methyltransferase
MNQKQNRSYTRESANFSRPRRGIVIPNRNRPTAGQILPRPRVTLKGGPSVAHPLASREWLGFVDELIPNYVKQEYSPQNSWKNRPFNETDARFFSRGIRELSELFTEYRPQGLPPYFDHPKYRSSYLLYFLPLQAAKFLTLFNLHSEAITAALKHAEKTGCLRILDLASGPGTASLALLLFLLESAAKLPLQKINKIELTWVDVNPAILADGKKLVEQIALKAESSLKSKVTIEVKLIITPWWKSFSNRTVSSESYSLVLMGNVLNEAKNNVGSMNHALWKNLFSLAHGGGVLFLEPAAKKSSQTLSHLRNHFFNTEIIEKTSRRIWGPCLHAEKCPLTDGRDWCHFSIPTEISGKWFKAFSRDLGSERQWLKFSYLWVTSQEYPSPTRPRDLKRVISDPMPYKTNLKTILLCEPETPGRKTISSDTRLHRGDLIRG